MDREPRRTWRWWIKVNKLKPLYLPIHKCKECNRGFIKTRGEDQDECIPCMKIKTSNFIK